MPVVPKWPGAFLQSFTHHVPSRAPACITELDIPIGRRSSTPCPNIRTQIVLRRSAGSFWNASGDRPRGKRNVHDVIALIPNLPCPGIHMLVCSYTNHRADSASLQTIWIKRQGLSGCDISNGDGALYRIYTSDWRYTGYRFYQSLEVS